MRGSPSEGRLLFLGRTVAFLAKHRNTGYLEGVERAHEPQLHEVVTDCCVYRALGLQRDLPGRADRVMDCHRSAHGAPCVRLGHANRRLSAARGLELT